MQPSLPWGVLRAMLVTIAIIVVVSGALLIGAAWGVGGHVGDRVSGALVALAGGALLLSVVSELIQPSIETASFASAVAGVLAGAAVFSIVDYVIDEKFGPKSGGGLLAAITLDGVPENLALGVALIGAGPMQAAALAGSILLSNLPEAAGGARDMCASGMKRWRIMGLWAATATLLSVAAIVGNIALEGAGDEVLALIRCFAAGAVIASLATEVFPKAYREDSHWAGIATALGAVLALYLGTLGSG